MRISDWSSDLFSSALSPNFAAASGPLRSPPPTTKSAIPALLPSFTGLSFDSPLEGSLLLPHAVRSRAGRNSPASLALMTRRGSKPHSRRLRPRVGHPVPARLSADKPRLYQ